MRTWQVELVAVALVLAPLAAARGWHEWLAAAAARARPEVACFRWMWGYFLAKEALWVAYFIATGANAALGGCAVFLAYPAWRRWWRRRHPIAAPPEPEPFPEAPSDVELVRDMFRGIGPDHLFHPTQEHIAKCEACRQTHRELMAKHLGVE